MVRTMYKLFVLASVVISCAALHDAYPLAPCTTPAYIWYILGCISVLLLLVSSFLIYVLVKTKFLQNFNIWRTKKFAPKPEKPEKVDEGNQTQTWQKKSMRRQNSDKNDSEIDIENNRTLKRQDSAVTTESDFNTIRAPKNSGGVSPRVIKNVVRDMPIILPEQMSQICKEVLNRKNKSKDSKGSLQNIDKLVIEGKAAVKPDLKYASTPELDLYDTLPTPQSAKQIHTEENFATNMTEHHIEKIIEKENMITNIKTSSSSNALTNQRQSSYDMYDFPKEVNSNAVEVCGIYDLPKEPSDTMQKNLNYIVAYFPTSNISETPNNLQEKPKYSFSQDPETCSRSSKENATNITSEAEKSRNPYEHYEIPIKGDHEETKMYINANDNFFTG